MQNALIELIDEADTTRRFSDVTDEQGHYLIQITGTGIKDIDSENPGTFRLLQNYPNPFNPATVIEYELKKLAHVTIEIFNVLGQKIKTLFDGFQSDHFNRIVWDATDDAGQGVPAGPYLYTMNADGRRMTRKMLLMDGSQGGGNTFVIAQRAFNGYTQNALNKHLSDKFLLRVSGYNIETYQQHNIVIASSMVLDLTVTRTTVTDIDGNVYKTVKIGNQWWMAENLAVTQYRNGDPIAHVTDGLQWSNLTSGAYCNYDNDVNHVATYGRLYNWYAVNDSRNIAHEGWHVPSDAEWKILVNYLGGSSVAGGKIKTIGTIEAGTGLWYAPNEDATNESDFSALPDGYRYDEGYYGGMGGHANFWSSSEVNHSGAWHRSLHSNYSDVIRGSYGKQYGFSVRCVRD